MRWGIILWAILVFPILYSMIVRPILLGFHDYLCVTKRVETDVLIIEAWLFPELLKQVPEEMAHGKYRYLIIAGTGMNGERTINKSIFKSYPQYAEAQLHGDGMDPGKMVVLPTVEANTHKTYRTAMAVREWLTNNEPEIKSINVFSGGAHARKTYITYKRAFGSGYNIGIIAASIKHYNPHRWWLSFRGIRATAVLSAACLYARFWLMPEN
jgi:hypothetical protein